MGETQITASRASIPHGTRRSVSPNGLYIWLVAIYRRSLHDLKMAILGGEFMINV